MSLAWAALAATFALLVFEPASAADPAADGTYPVALASCDGGAGDGWTVLEPSDPRRHVAVAWLRTLVRRDAERLVDASSLPLHVRYPKRYLEQGTRLEYAIDAEVTTRAAASSELQRLIDHEQRQDDGDDELARLVKRGSYRSASRAGGTVVIQVCPEVHADGTYETIELDLKRVRGHVWEIRGIEVGWQSFM